LAVTLVPALRRVRAPTAFAQAEPRPRSSPTAAAIWLMMTAAHGRLLSQGTARGRTRQRSASGVSKPGKRAVVRKSILPCRNRTENDREKKGQPDERN
jgi:hypothetical protein